MQLRRSLAGRRAGGLWLIGLRPIEARRMGRGFVGVKGKVGAGGLEDRNLTARVALMRHLSVRLPLR